MDWISEILLRSSLAYAIVAIYVMIKITIFGDINDAPLIESLLVFGGAIYFEELIVRKLFGDK